MLPGVGAQVVSKEEGDEKLKITEISRWHNYSVKENKECVYLIEQFSIQRHKWKCEGFH
jgi:hypothetical protein